MCMASTATTIEAPAMTKKGLADLAGLSGLVTVPSGERTCPGCAQPLDRCRCAAEQEARARRSAPVRVWLETSGRRGKGVTVVKGLPLDAAALVALAAQLKAACGSGGTAKDGQIEIQGDRRDTVMATLQQLGYAPKRAGG